ncbi:MAG TPA: glycosyltransferase, partial [Longimicrobium sp.]|nr:glycosyltransferase [Longimicrobium sp.]
PTGSPIRLAFLGRVDGVKGLGTLIAAVRATAAELRLDVFAVASPGSEALEREMRQAAAPDPRIRFLPPVPAERVIDTIAGYDVLAVPSEVKETGPLVVLEAFAAGVPVIGSALGGIAELVTDGMDGVLVEAGGWSAALAALRPDEVDRLRAGVRPPRTMAAVAEEMELLYRRIVPRVPAGAW